MSTMGANVGTIQAIALSLTKTGLQTGVRFAISFLVTSPKHTVLSMHELEGGGNILTVNYDYYILTYICQCSVVLTV